MGTPRKRHTKEFKVEVIRLAESSNKPKAQIEQELGITNGLLGKWREKYKDEGLEAFPGKGNLKPTDERIRDLERENVRLRQEREILKKVLGIFSRESS
jgi:transposase